MDGIPDLGSSPAEDLFSSPYRVTTRPPARLLETTKSPTQSHTTTDAETVRDPVRSPLDNPVIARLVAGSVTTSEPLVLYVDAFVGFPPLLPRGATG